MAVLVKQAYTGSLSTAKEARLHDMVNSHYDDLRMITGFRYEIQAFGSREFCLEVAEWNHYDLHL
jgi:hypothetical protein